MTNSIDYIVENIIRMGPNFISRESVMNTACVDKKEKKKLNSRKFLYDLLKTAIKKLKPNLAPLVL